jgi:hypothetical protein
MKMRTDVSLKTRIEDQCKLAGFDTDYLYKHGKKVLKIVHDACRNTALDADDLVEDLCSDSYETDEFRKLSEAVVRLEFFETSYMKDKYEANILRTMRTAWMLKVIDRIKMNVYTFETYGPQFVEILNLCYLSNFRYTGSEAAETIGISEQDFYKKKKYAIIMFALEFEEFKREYEARCSTACMSGEQMTLSDFSN